MQSNLSPQLVAAWLREQGQLFNQMADQIEAAFRVESAFPNSRTVVGVPVNSGTVTPQQLEARIRERSGRIKDVAELFNVDRATIVGLLEPASNVYLAERGWLKVRQ
jgi:hypothetical protein